MYNNIVSSMNDHIRGKIQLYLRKFPQVKDLHINPSNIAHKRLTATFIMNRKAHTIHFGLAGAHTFADGAAKSKRDSYRARASKITNKNGEYTYKIPGTANSFAYHLLW